MRPRTIRGIVSRLARNGYIVFAFAGGCCWHHCGFQEGGLHDPGHEPAPHGSAVNAWYEEQANRAEASDFTINLNEWYMGGLDLGPFGLHHIADIARRAPDVPFPVVIEPHLDAALNEQRRQHIVNTLMQQGIGDAEARVIVAYPQAEGLYAEEGTRLFYEMFMNRSHGGRYGRGGFGWNGGFDGGWGNGGWGGGGGPGWGGNVGWAGFGWTGGGVPRVGVVGGYADGAVIR